MATTQPKARKQHQCCWCQKMIEVGEVYQRDNSRFYFDGQTYYENRAAHLACAALADQRMEEMVEAAVANGEFMGHIEFTVSDVWDVSDEG